jgi:hypothetical protein
MSQVNKETEVIFGARNKHQVLEKQELYVKDDNNILQPVNPNNLLNGGGGTGADIDLSNITDAGKDVIADNSAVKSVNGQTGDVEITQTSQMHKIPLYFAEPIILELNNEIKLTITGSPNREVIYYLNTT